MWGAALAFKYRWRSFQHPQTCTSRPSSPSSPSLAELVRFPPTAPGRILHDKGLAMCSRSSERRMRGEPTLDRAATLAQCCSQTHVGCTCMTLCDAGNTRVRRRPLTLRLTQANKPPSSPGTAGFALINIYLRGEGGGEGGKPPYSLPTYLFPFPALQVHSGYLGCLRPSTVVAGHLLIN